MSKNSRFGFVRDAASLFGAQGIISIVAIATAVVMARALGAGGRGQFSLALLLASMLVTFTDFGMGTSGPRFMATRRWPAPDILASHALAGAVRVLVTGFLGLGLIVFARDIFFPGVPAEFLVLGLFQMVPLTVAGFVLPLLLGLEQNSTYSRLLVLSSSLSFGALSAAWVIAGLDVWWALLLQLAAGLTTSIVIWKKTIQATGGFGRPNMSYLGEAYRFGAGVYASNIAGFANVRLILLLINGYTGSVAVGLYTIAQTATDRLYLMADAVGTILLPRVAENPEQNSARLTPFVFRATLVVVVPAAFLLAVVADWLVRFLFTDAFAGAVFTLRLLLVAVVFSSGWRVLSQDLNARGRSGLTASVNGAAAVVSLSVAVVLLPRIGLDGAAWAAIISAGLSFIAGVWFFSRYSGERRGAATLFVPSARERELAARLIRGATYVVRLGPAFWWALVRAYLLDGLAIRFAILAAPFRRRIRAVWGWMCIPYDQYWAYRLQPKLVLRSAATELVQLDELGLPDAAVEAVRAASRDGGPVVLGEFDHYGQLIPTFGPIEGLVCTIAEDARPRSRSRVTLVTTSQGIGVRKEYFGFGARRRFLRELRVLERLRDAAVRAPEVLAIDVAGPALIETFIPGADLEQVMSAMGARLTGAACRARLGGDPSWLAILDDYLREGAQFAAQLEPTLLDAIHEQLRIAHHHGVELYDLKYGNIVVHRKTGLPFLVDFDSARLHRRPQGVAFLVERDRDTERLNRMLGTNYLTYDRLGERLKQKKYPAADRTYASTYIGHGLRLGPLWDRATGFGRWHFILKRHLRLPKGSRILSVGPNNASVEIHLLRQGAAEVVAYERDGEYAAQGRFLVAACEWADNREYPLRYVQADMREAANADGRFDCALALCSLYYLTEDQMRCLAAAIAKKAPRFILQCNVRQGIDREDRDQYRRASLEFAINLLHEAGFIETTVTAPKGYSRPLVSGVHPHSKVHRRTESHAKFSQEIYTNCN